MLLEHGAVLLHIPLPVGVDGRIVLLRHGHRNAALGHLSHEVVAASQAGAPIHPALCALPPSQGRQEDPGAASILACTAANAPQGKGC